MKIKELVKRYTGPILKSHCQWCGEDICHTKLQHELYGNMCRTCRNDFYDQEKKLISSRELSARIARRRALPETEIWHTDEGDYVICKITQTAEKYE